jgi:hypothetical protein
MRILLVLCVVLAALAAPAAVHAQGVPGLEIVAPDKLAVALDNDAATKSVWVRNTSLKPTLPEFATLLEDSDGNEKSVSATPVRASSLRPGQEKRYRLRFTTDEDVDGATGELWVSGAGAPGSIELTVSKKTIVDRGVTEALVYPLLVALAMVVLLAVVTLPGRDDRWAPLPGSVDFKDSFASGLTAAGAILGTILTASVLPEQTTTLSKEGYAALNLTFGILIVVAAFVYAAMQPPGWSPIKKEKEADPDEEQLELTGSVLGFLIAALITVWATVGELWLVARLLGELGSSKGVSSSMKIVLGIAVVVVLLLLVLYVYRRFVVLFTDKREKKPPTTRGFGPQRILDDVPAAPVRRSVSLL